MSNAWNRAFAFALLSTLTRAAVVSNLVQNPMFTSTLPGACQSGFCISTNNSFIAPWIVGPCSNVLASDSIDPCREQQYEVDVGIFGQRNNIDLNPNGPSQIYQDIVLPTGAYYGLNLTFDLSFNPNCGRTVDQLVETAIKTPTGISLGSQVFKGVAGTWTPELVIAQHVCGTIRVTFTSLVPGASCGNLITNVNLITGPATLSAQCLDGNPSYSSSVPTDCGGPALPLPSEPDLMLPTRQDSSFIGGDVQLVFTVPNFAQTIGFATSTYTYTTTSRTVSGTGCTPTIVGWATTWQSSIVTSTKTSIGALTFAKPFLKGTGPTLTGCFMTATIAETANCMVHQTVTTSSAAVINGATATPTVTSIHAYGALDVQANSNTTEAQQIYPFLVSYPYQASSVTLASGNLNTAVTFSIVSEDFAVTNGDTGSGFLNFVISSVPGDSHYIVSSIRLTSPVQTGAYITSSPMPGRFGFYNISAACGPPVTYQATATICRMSVPQTSANVGQCMTGSTPDVDASFTITSTPRQVDNTCAFVMTVGGVTDIQASIQDTTSTPASSTLYATDTWQISITSNNLQTAGDYIAVTSVSVGDGSGGVVNLDKNCFSSDAAGYGLNIFSFPAGILPLDVKDYKSTSSVDGWSPLDQRCSSGFLLANNAATTYTFNFTLQFDGTTVPGAPLSRRDIMWLDRRDAGAGASGSQFPKAGTASLAVTVQAKDGAATGSGTSTKSQGMVWWEVLAIVAGVFGVLSFCIVLASCHRRKRIAVKEEADRISKSQPIC